MKLKITIFILLSFTFINVFAQESAQDRSSLSSSGVLSFREVPTELINRSTKFFDEIIDLKLTTGYNSLLDRSPIADKKNQLENLITQTKRSFEVYGNLQYYEFVSAELVAPSYIRLRYLGLHTKHPMRWIFTYYKSPELGWIVTNIKFDDLTEFYFTDQ